MVDKIEFSQKERKSDFHQEMLSNSAIPIQDSLTETDESVLPPIL